MPSKEKYTLFYTTKQQDVQGNVVLIKERVNSMRLRKPSVSGVFLGTIMNHHSKFANGIMMFEKGTYFKLIKKATNRKCVHPSL